MRSPIDPSVVLVVTVGLVLLAGCAATPQALSEQEAWGKFVGEWVNADYTGVMPYAQKLVLRADFKGEAWLRVTDTRAASVWDVRVRKWWTDRSGATYWQFHSRQLQAPYSGDAAALLKVDGLGQTLEMDLVFSAPETGPTAEWAFKKLEKLDPEYAKAHPDVACYRVYHRK